MNDIGYLDLPFHGSEMEINIKTTRTKESLRYRLGYTQGAIDFHTKEQNPKQVDTFLDTTDMIGLNVTIPYKEVALAHCNHISQIAERIGCINTMVKRDGTWFGDNTDYNGVIYALRYANISVDRKQCLILGDGATSKTVHVALEDLGASDIIHISRHNHSNLS